MKFDFLKLFNAIATAQTSKADEFVPAESLETPITREALGLDSLDLTMVFFVLGEAYNIPPDSDLDQEWPVSSVGDLLVFIEAHKTQDPEDEFDTIEKLVKELS
jgi:acyl carrier protein